MNPDTIKLAILGHIFNTKVFNEGYETKNIIEDTLQIYNSVFSDNQKAAKSLDFPPF